MDLTSIALAIVGASSWGIAIYTFYLPVVAQLNQITQTLGGM